MKQNKPFDINSRESVEPTSDSKNKPPQPGEQSKIAPNSSKRDKDGTIEKEGNVEPQQG